MNNLAKKERIFSFLLDNIENFSPLDTFITFTELRIENITFTLHRDKYIGRDEYAYTLAVGLDPLFPHNKELLGYSQDELAHLFQTISKFQTNVAKIELVYSQLFRVREPEL
jgi:hypothetical protein